MDFSEGDLVYEPYFDFLMIVDFAKHGKMLCLCHYSENDGNMDGYDLISEMQLWCDYDDVVLISKGEFINEWK